MKTFNLNQLPGTGLRVPAYRKLPLNHQHATTAQSGFRQQTVLTGNREPETGNQILVNNHIKFRFLVPIQQNRMSNQCGFTLTDVRYIIRNKPPIVLENVQKCVKYLDWNG